MIKSEIVADSINTQGDRLISVLCTFPRIILAEVNTHRMLSKNTSSSRAIPFKKMLEAVENNPFIPIAWQKEHKGMQGSEYITDENTIKARRIQWLKARDNAIKSATELNFTNTGFTESEGVTKQLCNRLLEPFMWTTMLITGSREGWDNFFHLRCPQYVVENYNNQKVVFKSKKELINFYNDGSMYTVFPSSDLEWLQLNKGQAEIHMMALAEAIYDSVNESTPKQLQAGEWHVPFYDKILPLVKEHYTKYQYEGDAQDMDRDIIKISTAMSARTSYTVVGDEKEIDYERLINLHNLLIEQDPPHSSPLEHCARAMDNKEYVCFAKGSLNAVEIDEPNKGEYVAYLKMWSDDSEAGWCGPYKGFMSYRYFIDNKLEVF